MSLGKLDALKSDELCLWKCTKIVLIIERRNVVVLFHLLRFINCGKLLGNDRTSPPRHSTPHPPRWGHLEEGRSSGKQLAVQVQSSAHRLFWLKTALNVKAWPFFSWEDSIPGCSSRCSGSHSCRTVVAANQSQSQKKKNQKKCRALLTVCIKIWAHTWYQLLYPAYPACAAASPPPTTGGGVVMGTCGTVDWVSADASTLEPSSTLCSFSGSSSLQKSRRCLSFVHNQNISANFFLCKVLGKWSSPILCSPLGSTQLVQQPLMSLIHRNHTAVRSGKQRFKIKDYTTVFGVLLWKPDLLMELLCSSANCRALCEKMIFVWGASGAARARVTHSCTASAEGSPESSNSSRFMCSLSLSCVAQGREKNIWRKKSWINK